MRLIKIYHGCCICILGVLFIFPSISWAQEAVTAQATSPVINEVQILYNSALTAKTNGLFLKARGILETILYNYPGFSKTLEVKKEWGKVMFRLIHSRVPVPESLSYEVKANDSLESIAQKFSTTVELIKMRNKLKGNHLKIGQRLSIWNHPFNIDVDKTRNRLYFKLDGETIKEYSVSTGKADSVTPVGQFVIKYRYPNPTWFHKGKIVKGGAPENFLGTRWLGLNIPKYGIHGTVFPELIGQSVSGGCIRMKNEDVEELYDIVPIGTEVVIRESLDHEMQSIEQ